MLLLLRISAKKNHIHSKMKTICIISIHHDEITIKIIEKSTENKPNAENVTFW